MIPYKIKIYILLITTGLYQKLLNNEFNTLTKHEQRLCHKIINAYNPTSAEYNPNFMASVMTDYPDYFSHRLNTGALVLSNGKSIHKMMLKAKKLTVLLNMVLQGEDLKTIEHDAERNTVSTFFCQLCATTFKDPEMQQTKKVILQKALENYPENALIARSDGILPIFLTACIGDIPATQLLMGYTPRWDLIATSTSSSLVHTLLRNRAVPNMLDFALHVCLQYPHQMSYGSLKLIISEYSNEFNQKPRQHLPVLSHIDLPSINPILKIIQNKNNKEEKRNAILTLMRLYPICIPLLHRRKILPIIRTNDPYKTKK